MCDGRYDILNVRRSPASPETSPAGDSPHSEENRRCLRRPSIIKILLPRLSTWPRLHVKWPSGDPTPGVVMWWRTQDIFEPNLSQIMASSSPQRHTQRKNHSRMPASECDRTSMLVRRPDPSCARSAGCMYSTSVFRNGHPGPRLRRKTSNISQNMLFEQHSCGTSAAVQIEHEVVCRWTYRAPSSEVSVHSLNPPNLYKHARR